MSAKPEAAAPAPAPAPAGGAEGAKPGKLAALLPVILVVVLAPIASWAVAQFVILPQFEKKLASVVAKEGSEGAAHGEASPAPVAAHGGGEGEKEGGHGKKGEAAGPTNSYEFTNIVVNLAGTMGTRYLKTTFMVTGKDANLREYFNRDKARMVDITLNVLSSLTLADLEEAGAKNIIREKLVNAYNQALGRKVAEQVYFSDFVVQ